MNIRTATAPGARGFRADPRHYQIAVLSSLLVFGIAVLGFDIRPFNVACVFVTGLGTQYIAGRLLGVDRFRSEECIL